MKLLQLEPAFLLYLQLDVESEGVIDRYVDEPDPFEVVIAARVTVNVTLRFFLPVTVNRAALPASYAMVDVVDRVIEPNGRVDVVAVTVRVWPIMILSTNTIATTTIIHAIRRCSE